MATQDQRSGRGRGSYHHGNLREALVQAALDMIAERGLAGVAVAELARAVGVSPAAPYRHFRDRGALLAEVARRGFEQLTAELEAAWGEGRPDPVGAIERCGRAYLAFARREPAAFAAMFGDAGTGNGTGGIPGAGAGGLGSGGKDSAASDDPAVRRASDAAFSVLRRAAEAACAASVARRRPPALMVALHVWSLAHGTAALFVGGGEATRRRLPMPPEDLLEAGLLLYLHALGLAEPPTDAAGATDT
jgi:AcrR family transcriptional regulator